MKYHIQTYGCQMNASDTERLMTVLEVLGYEPASSENEADLLFFNTCSIRKKAEDRMYGRMKMLKAMRRERPDLMVGITGCMVQKSSTKYSTQRDKLVGYEPVDVALRIEDLAKLGQLLKEARPEMKWSILGEVDEGTLGNYFKIAPKRASKAQVWIPIQTGCDKYCTFCIVPFTRGRERSRPMEDILRECEEAVENGAVEITLIGQTVDSYGLSVGDKMSGQFKIQSEIPNVVFKSAIFNAQNGSGENLMASAPEAKTREHAERPFVTLLRAIDRLKAKGLKRLRFISPHPQDFSEDLIVLHQELQTLQPYIHLPVQAGNNDVLKAMRRTYTREHYLALIQLIRRYIPDCAISTDIIVGFPVETEEAFEETVDLIKTASFDMAFLAQYSPRRGTYSEKHLKNDVSAGEKARRFHRLNGVLKELSAEKHVVCVGKTAEVLVEKQEGMRCCGRTPEFKQIFFDAGRDLVGQCVDVRIEKAHDWFLEGVLV